MSFEQAENTRRLGQIIEIGTVSAVTDYTVTVDCGDLSILGVRVAFLRAGRVSFKWMPAVGEQVIFVAPNGDLKRAVIIGSLPTGGAAPSAVPTIDLVGGALKINGNLEIEGGITTTEDVVAGGVSVTKHTHSGVNSGAEKTKGPDK